MEVLRRWGPGLGGFIVAALYLWVLPEVLGSMTMIPSFVQSLMNGAIFAFLTLNLLLGVTLATGLPSKVEVWESEGYTPGKGAASRRQDLKRAGLVPKEPIKVSISGGVHLLTLESPEGDITATVFDLGFMAGVDVISQFEGGYMLFTGDKRDGGTLPQHPRDLRQILPGTKAGGLMMAHRRAIAYLERQGLVLKPMKAADIPQAIIDYQIRTRATFMDAPYKNTIISTLRTVSRLNPFLKPIQEQGLDLREGA